MTLLIILFILSLVVIGYCMYRINYLVKVIKTDTKLFRKQEESRLELISKNAELQVHYRFTRGLLEANISEKEELANSLETMTDKFEKEHILASKLQKELNELKESDNSNVVDSYSESLSTLKVEYENLLANIGWYQNTFKEQNTYVTELMSLNTELKGQIEELEVELANTTSMMLSNQKAKETIDLLIKTKQAILVVDDGRDALKEAIKEKLEPKSKPILLASTLPYSTSVTNKQDTPEFKKEPWRRKRK